MKKYEKVTRNVPLFQEGKGKTVKGVIQKGVNIRRRETKAE